MQVESTSSLTGSDAFLRQIPIDVVIELGRVQMTIRELASLSPDDILELEQPAYQPLSVVVAGKIIARGELVMHNDTLSLQITEIPAPGQTSLL